MSRSILASLPSEQEMLEALGGSLEPWHHQCHKASLALVQSGLFSQHSPRVARGFAPGVPGQHSWMVLGGDCYAPGAVIVDAVLWSYVDSVQGIWVGTAKEWGHRPHGAGSIWAWGRPHHQGGETILLTPRSPFSAEASLFLELLGPLDYRGWGMLAHAPVEGWPAGEIYEAMADTAPLAALVPIDRLGMLTRRNPGGLYLPPEEEPSL